MYTDNELLKAINQYNNDYYVLSPINDSCIIKNISPYLFSFINVNCDKFHFKNLLDLNKVNNPKPLVLFNKMFNRNSLIYNSNDFKNRNDYYNILIDYFIASSKDEWDIFIAVNGFNRLTNYLSHLSIDISYLNEIRKKVSNKVLNDYLIKYIENGFKEFSSYLRKLYDRHIVFNDKDVPDNYGEQILLVMNNNREAYKGRSDIAKLKGLKDHCITLSMYLTVLNLDLSKQIKEIIMRIESDITILHMAEKINADMQNFSASNVILGKFQQLSIDSAAICAYSNTVLPTNMSVSDWERLSEEKSSFIYEDNNYSTLFE